MFSFSPAGPDQFEGPPRREVSRFEMERERGRGGFDDRRMHDRDRDRERERERERPRERDPYERDMRGRDR